MSEIDDRPTFVELTLEGGRFDRLGLPLDTVSELERYGRIVAEVAKDIWRKSNPGRNLPAGFSESLALRLTRVDKGSVVPILTKDEITPGLDEVSSILDAAREVVDAELGRISHGNYDEIRLPKKALRPLRKFGQSLNPDERLILTGDQKDHTIWTQSVRKRYLAHAEDTAISAQGLLAGTIRALDSEDQTFKFCPAGSSSSIKGHFSDKSMFDEFHSFQRSENDLIVKLDAEYRSTADGDLVDITDANSIDILIDQTTPRFTRLTQLLGLKQGWLDGDSGDQIRIAIVESVRDLLTTLDASQIESPSIYPLESGELRLEWHKTATYVEIEARSTLDFEIYSTDLIETETTLNEINRERTAAIVVNLMEGRK